MWQEGLWRIMRHCGVPEELVVLIEDIYSKSRSAVRVEGELTDWFQIKVGAISLDRDVECQQIYST